MAALLSSSGLAFSAVLRVSTSGLRILRILLSLEFSAMTFVFYWLFEPVGTGAGPGPGAATSGTGGAAAFVISYLGGSKLGLGMVN